jgi:hypothetical protein
MEASERPQLELGDDGDATVRALDDRIEIRSLTVADQRAAHLVRERQQLGKPAVDTVRKAIEIGARVLDSEETAANVDYVRRELEAGLGQIDRKLGGTLAEGAEELAERIAATFGAERNDSVQAQIKEIVTAQTRQDREELLERLTAEDPSNPLVGMQVRIGKKLVETEERHRQEMQLLRESHSNESRAMQGQVAELKEHLARLLDKQEHDQQLAEAEEAGTRKGRTFEELVHETIEQIAAAQGDAAHHTGDSASESGGKKGDSVVEIGGALGAPVATIVFEAKNKRLSKNDAWTELNSCIGERDACFAVLVVAGDDKVPAGLEELTEYQGNKMIAVIDRDEPDPLALRLVYRYVRARVLAERSTELEVDAAGVRDAAEEAGARLKRANRVRKSLTNVTNSARAAGEEFDEMVADVERCLARIEGLVAAAAAGDAD